MSYYILQKGYELCGFKGLPFGLRRPDPSKCDFFNEEQYRVVYALDGKHDIDEDSLSEKQKKLLENMKEAGIAIPSDGNERLEPWQEYKVHPAMFKSSVQWSITGRCNYNCRHCFMSAPDYKGEDLTLEQSEHILDELAHCGIRMVSITGGEPFVNPNFYGILDKMKEKDICLSTLYSNGKLVNEELINELEKRNMRPVFHMSFDGVGWHDWLRGKEGAEAAVINAFKLLQRRGFQTSSSMVLHKHNIGTLRESINLLSSLGLVHLKMNVAAPTGRWKNETEHFISQDDANHAILDYIPQYVADGMPMSVQFCGILEFDRLKRRITIPYKKFTGVAEAEKSWACGSVKNTMYISPTGRILPCMTMGGTAMDPFFDSCLEKPLSEILSDSYYRDTCLIKMGECIEHNEECRGCKYRLSCGGGCRSCACGETGTDYRAIDPDPCHFFKSGWYEKALGVIEKYKDSFPDTDKTEDIKNINN
ncbi:MAG: radical SAM protein [Lachnospiraceae bacterium]|nr:radical SAM protein [Lachnospiraceae bacterium]